MRKASTVLLEQGTQTPSPAPDLIPAETLTENLHRNWPSKRGHFTTMFLFNRFELSYVHHRKLFSLAACRRLLEQLRASSL